MVELNWKFGNLRWLTCGRVCQKRRQRVTKRLIQFRTQICTSVGAGFRLADMINCNRFYCNCFRGFNYSAGGGVNIKHSQVTSTALLCCRNQHHHWLIVDHVACSSKQTFRVDCADVAVTCGFFQTSVVSVDDVDDTLSVTVDSYSFVFTCHGTQRCDTYKILIFYPETWLLVSIIKGRQAQDFLA